MPSLLTRAINKLIRIPRRGGKSFYPTRRVGVVGLGAIAPDHLLEYDNCPLARVVAVCDVVPSALAASLDAWPHLAGYLDYRQMLAEARPQILSVCTWPQSHAEIVRAAAEAGVKAILCEKPLALTLADVRAMLSVCNEKGVKLAGGHQYRFHPAFLRAAEVIRAGTLGPVKAVSGCIWSTLANNGPHLFDTVRFLLGDLPARQVTSRCERLNNGFNRGYPAEESAEGEFTFEGGIPFHFATGQAAPEFFVIRMECQRGRLEVTPRSLLVNDAAQKLPGDLSAACRRAQFRQFVRWVRGKQDHYVANAKASAASAELVLAAYEAARLGTALALPLRNDRDIIRQLYPDEPRQEGCNSSLPTTDSAMTLPPHSDRLAIDGGIRAVPHWFSTRPTMGVRELVGVARVIASKHLNAVDGRAVSELEREFAACYGARTAIASTSGTAALHVALGTLNPEPCAEVITTPVTDMGSVIPILACNCVPVFADIDPMTGNLTPDSIAAKITPRTVAVILVHLFGRPAALGPIGEMLRKRGICLIEDCSQAHYAAYDAKLVGTFGDFGCFSFQQSKQMTCGDGGVTLVNRADLADRAAMFVDKGWDRRHGTRSHLFLGMNYRMTELQAAVALAQLRRLPNLIAARRATAERLTELLSAIPGVLVPVLSASVTPSWWKFLFQLDEEATGVPADAFAAALQVEGVRVSREYVPRPIFEYDVLKGRQTYGTSGYPLNAVKYRDPAVEDYPGFAEFSRRLLLLAWSQHVRERHVKEIARAVRKVAKLLPIRLHQLLPDAAVLQEVGR
jgi:dTDP-4-amino-4,6-dideoxygalactose transaminase/predicted dehydrogenase